MASMEINYSFRELYIMYMSSMGLNYSFRELYMMHMSSMRLNYSFRELYRMHMSSMGLNYTALESLYQVSVISDTRLHCFRELTLGKCHLSLGLYSTALESIIAGMYHHLWDLQTFIEVSRKTPLQFYRGILIEVLYEVSVISGTLIHCFRQLYSKYYHLWDSTTILQSFI